MGRAGFEVENMFVENASFLLKLGGGGGTVGDLRALISEINTVVIP
jgi:hypothetical protein